MMFGRNQTWTGIDLGADRIKLVHGQGGQRFEKITHIGTEPWGRRASDDPVQSASAALGRLFERLDLKPKKLGHVAVTAACPQMSVRDVAMPPMSAEELRSCLQFESRKHLDLESLDNPVVDAQIVEEATPTEDGGAGRMRVLMAAVPSSYLDFALQVVEPLGLEPEVVDLEVFASLNELFAHRPPDEARDLPLGLLNLGTESSRLNIASRTGGVMSRVVGIGAPLEDDGDLVATYFRGLVGQIRDTLTYYRGRFRREVDELHVAGGGAYLPGLLDTLRTELSVEVSILDPLVDCCDTAEGLGAWQQEGARFVTACGLCRWWDGDARV